jgi:hypothetical protein
LINATLSWTLHFNEKEEPAFTLVTDSKGDIRLPAIVNWHISTI